MRDIQKNLMARVTAESKDSPLEQWWMADARQQLDATVAKMAEYGAGDLDAIGHTLGNMVTNPPPVSFTELGIYFYIVGKLARITDALQHGRAPSDDTWFDLEVYTKMVRAIRAGKWGPR